MKKTIIGLFALLAVACGGTNSTPVVTPDSGTPDSGIPDSGTPDAGDAGSDGGPIQTAAGCFINAQTSIQILNACTDAGSIDKAPVLPLLQSDGGLPPLP
ncbi:MAG TPA: hypothetical protein VH083_10815 [Myxococcales bacterium]|nr:hypothetical protein [Myxococcales bacterium]